MTAIIIILGALCFVLGVRQMFTNKRRFGGS